MSVAHGSKTVITRDLFWPGALGLLMLAAGGCTKTSSAAKPSDPLAVQVQEVVQRDVPIYSDWIGTLDGLVNADIKAEVTGYLVQQAYTEGSFVKAGALLFQIDPRPFQAVLDQMEGQLAQSEGQLEHAQAQLAQAEAQVAVAEANQRRTQLDVERYTPLAQEQAITQQDLDNATQYNVAAKAQLQAAKAQVETAKAQITAAAANVKTGKAAVETARINQDHVADRRYSRNRATAGWRAGESGERSDYYRLNHRPN